MPAAGAGFLGGALLGSVLGHAAGSSLSSSSSHDRSSSESPRAPETYHLFNSTMGAPIIYFDASTNQTEHVPAICICWKKTNCNCKDSVSTTYEDLPAGPRTVQMLRDLKTLVIDGNVDGATSSAIEVLAARRSSYVWPFVMCIILYF